MIRRQEHGLRPATRATGREHHTATLLPSGQVLVAGGYSHGGPLSSAKLYNPATGNWSNTGSMSHYTVLAHSDVAAFRPSAGGRRGFLSHQRGAV